MSALDDAWDGWCEELLRLRWGLLRVLVLLGVMALLGGDVPAEHVALDARDRVWFGTPDAPVALLVAAHAAAVVWLAVALVAPRWMCRGVLQARLGRGPRWQRAGRLLVRALWCGLVGWVGCVVVWPRLSGGAFEPRWIDGFMVLGAPLFVALVAGWRRVGWWFVALLPALWAGLLGGRMWLGAIALVAGGLALALLARSVAPAIDRRAAAMRGVVSLGLLACVAWPGHPLGVWASLEGAWRVPELGGWSIYDVRAGRRGYEVVEYRISEVTLKADGCERTSPRSFAGETFSSEMTPAVRLWPFALGYRSVGRWHDRFLYRVPLTEARRAEADARARALHTWRRGCRLVERGEHFELVAPDENADADALWPHGRPTVSRDLTGASVHAWRPLASERDIVVRVANGTSDVIVVVGIEGFDALARAAEASLGIPRDRWAELVGEPRERWPPW